MPLQSEIQARTNRWIPNLTFAKIQKGTDIWVAMLIFTSLTAHPQNRAMPLNGILSCFLHCALLIVSEWLLRLEFTTCCGQFKRTDAYLILSKWRGKKKLLYYRHSLFSACGWCEAAKATCFGLWTPNLKSNCWEEVRPLGIFMSTGETSQPQSQTGQELPVAWLCWQQNSLPFTLPADPLMARILVSSSSLLFCLFSGGWAGET